MEIIINDNSINPILNVEETTLESSIVIEEVILNPTINIQDTILETEIIIQEIVFNPELNIEETVLETTIVIEENITNVILNIEETIVETAIVVEEIQIPAADGKSAYEIAVENGFVGTEAEWLASLQGEDGEQGLQGDKGNTGDKGNDGEQGSQGIQGLSGFAFDVTRIYPNGYLVGDIVNYLGNYYICIANNDALIPPTTLGVYWNPYSFVGPQGEQGIQGEKGDTGDTGLPGVGIPTGGLTGQILTKVDETDYNTIWQDNYADWTSVVKHIVRNNGVELIRKGTPVYVTGSNGTNMLVGKASNASEATSSKTIGLMQSDLTITGGNQTGFIITEGLLGGLNTSGKNAGDPVWLGANGTLIYGLANKPYAPNHLVFIGIVTKISAGNGEIFVKVQNGFELKEIHDVDLITTTPINGNLLGYNGTLWVNKTIAYWLNLATTGTPNSSTYLRGDYTWDKGFTWSDYIFGKLLSVNITITGGKVQEFSYAGTTDKRYRFVGNPYNKATDIIYTTFSSGVLSNPIAYRLITL